MPYQFTELYTYTQAGLVTTKQLNATSYTNAYTSLQTFSLQTSQTLRQSTPARVQTVTYAPGGGPTETATLRP